jgi:hypothetical protein
MALQLATSSAVVAAQQFNPSVTGQHWLIQNGVVLPEEFQVGSVFTDMFAQIPTRDFLLQITPENCQFHFPQHVAKEKQPELIKERLAKIVNLLPHTPYTAVGFNFVWHFFPGDNGIAAECRRLFFEKDKPLHNAFNKEDARFGAYMSMTWKAYRVRLDAKPVIQLIPPEQRNEMIQFAFNYHLEVAGRPEPYRDIIASFDQWIPAYDMAFSILSTIEGN